jgi:hypothetical protein
VIAAGAMNENETFLVFTKPAGINPAAYFSSRDVKLFEHCHPTP